MPRRSFADERFTERSRGETIFDFDAGAPLFISPGEAASSATQRSCNRPGPDKPAFRAAWSTRSPLRRSVFTCSSVRHCKKSFGITPAHAEKSR